MTSAARPMQYIAGTSRSKRAAALLAVVAIHATLLTLFLNGRTGGEKGPVQPGRMTVMLVPKDAASTPPPPPTMPSKVVAKVRKVLSESPSIAPDPQALAGNAGGCSTLEIVSAAILSNPPSLDSVVSSPPEIRSVADAIVIWNAGWAEPANALGAPLLPVRDVVLQSLATETGECLDAPVLGPRLIAVPNGEKSIVLVFGSGDWTWRQLTAEAEPAVDEGGNPVRTILPGANRNSAQ